MRMTLGLLTVFLVLAAGLFMPRLAQAASDTASGTVDILEAVTVTSTVDMDFGEILPPTSSTQDFVMAAATGVVTPGSGDGDAFGSPTAASFDITGTANMSISSTPTVTTDFASAALTLATPTQAGDTATIPGDGDGVITVGATLTVASTATENTYNDAVITLTVNYQ